MPYIPLNLKFYFHLESQICLIQFSFLIVITEDTKSKNSNKKNKNLTTGEAAYSPSPRQQLVQTDESSRQPFTEDRLKAAILTTFQKKLYLCEYKFIN